MFGYVSGSPTLRMGSFGEGKLLQRNCMETSLTFKSSPLLQVLIPLASCNSPGVMIQDFICDQMTWHQINPKKSSPKLSINAVTLIYNIV